MEENFIAIDGTKATQGFVHSVYNESPYGIIVFNSQLIAVDWNPAVEILLGVSKEECIGKELFDILYAAQINLDSKKTDHPIKAIVVISQKLTAYFPNGMLNGIKTSVIVDKSGAVNGGTIILSAMIS